MSEQATQTMDVHYMSRSYEWYTPQEILDRVQRVFEIDLDPCSNSHDAPNVQARIHYTREDDGLTRQWHGRVFMNPPYGRVLSQWIRHLVNEHKAGRVTEAIALVPSRTDTQWFRSLRQYPRCFLWGRLRFSDAGSAPFPSMLVYLGSNVAAFRAAFADVGDVYELTND